jgi:cephalosporin-C deacetylase
MPRYDLSPPELERYDPQLEAPPDLEAFWGQTLEQTRAHALDPTATRIETPLVAVETFDASWRGYGGDVVRGWLHLPARALRGSAPLSAVVQFQGYNGGRGLAFEHVFWATAGYAHLVVDTRGQGSGWAVGDTPDPAGSAPAQPGFLTRGITNPADYYYRRVYADAVRAVEFMQAQAGVDPAAIAVTGASQGGGLTLAAAALADGVAGAMPDVPFLCDFPRASQIALGEPYAELVRYLAAHRDHEREVFATLSYFDGAVLSAMANAPALFSVALMDEICPPSTVYAAFNAYGGPKQIVAYPYNDHEGGEAFHRRRQVTWLADLLPSSVALFDLAERADHDGPAATRR